MERLSFTFSLHADVRVQGIVFDNVNDRLKSLLHKRAKFLRKLTSNATTTIIIRRIIVRSRDRLSCILFGKDNSL